MPLTDGIRLERLSLPEVKLDYKKLFSKLGAAWAQGSIASILGVAEVVATQTPLETVAWRLIHEGTRRALVELLDRVRRPKITDDKPLARTATAFGESLRENDLDLEPGFLKNPAASPIARHLKASFGQWLKENGFDSNEQRDLLARFDAYFVRGLHDAWRADAPTYERLSKALDSPFAASARMEQDWLAYQTRLASAMDEPVFQETFSIGDVYIPLRGSYQEPLPLKEEERAAHRYTTDKPQHRTVIVDLEADFRNWLTQVTPETAIRVLRGAPGSGKSTIARKLAADVAAAGRMRVILIPLQPFGVHADMMVGLRTYLTGPNRPFRQDPTAQSGFATPERPLLLVFDGLDELGLEGKERDQETRDFLQKLRSYVHYQNDGGPVRVLALVTGRTVVVQATGEAAGDRQELTVLSYAPVEEERPGQLEIHDPYGLASKDQRVTWWDLYHKVRPSEPTTLPEAMLAPEIAELSAEPLLNYLLVLSNHHRNTEKPGPASRNRIYADLIRQVLEGVHGGRKASCDGGLAVEDVEELLELVATAAWYGGDGRVATKKDVCNACPDGMKSKLDTFLKTPGGLVGLVAAFFFQESESTKGERGSFEFTHKSFCDYLTARRIVRQVSEAHQLFTDPKGNASQEQKVTAVLKNWVALFGGQMLTWEVVNFLLGEVALMGENDRKTVIGWQATAAALFQRMLDEGLPVLDSRNFREAEQRSRNTQVSLFAVLSACGRVTKELTQPHWPNSSSAGTLFLNIFGQITPLTWEIPLICDWFYFQGQILRGLPRAPKSITSSDFRDADLSGANLSNINFFNTNLSGVDFSESNLSYSFLSRVNLSSSNLSNANLLRANLLGADLSDSNLFRANLFGATLIHVDLSRADLSEADLSEADLITVHTVISIKGLGTHPSHTDIVLPLRSDHPFKGKSTPE